MRVFQDAFPIRYRVILFLYILINLVLHFFSLEGASYTHGADAGRYFIPALNLASGNGMGDISSTGPLYPIYLAIHIYIFGEQNTLTAVVISQSVLLFLTGYIASNLSKNLGLSVLPLTVVIFVIMNPNSLMITHLIQTETLFTFLLTLYFFYLYKYIKFLKLNNLIILAFLAVFISLTRPAGMYVMFFFFLISSSTLFTGSILKIWFKHNLIYLVILIIGLGSNAIYNYKIHNEYFVSANKGFVFYDQYIALLQYGYGLSAEEAHHKSKTILLNRINPDLSHCVNNLTEIKCKDEISSIFINEIINAKPTAIIKGFSTSVLSLLFSGGASNFANYFGIDAKKHVIEMEHSEGGMFQIQKIYQFISNINFNYFLAIIIFWGWAFITKLLMIIGGAYEFSKGNKLYFFSMSIIIILFIAEYLFLGQSRWRAPIDPIFMIFAAVGSSLLINKLKVLFDNRNVKFNPRS